MDGFVGVEVEHHDIRDIAQVRKALRDADVVYHLAGVISIDRSTDAQLVPVNVHGARHVAQVCLESGVGKLIHFSSIHALSPNPVQDPVTEERPLATEPSVPAYDRSKADGDREILKSVQQGLHAVTIHPTGVIGPDDRIPSQMGGTLLDMYHGRLAGALDGGFNWVDVRDVVTGTLAAAEQGAAGERFLLGGHWASVTELCDLVHELGGARRPLLTAPMWLARAVAPLSAAVVRNMGGRPHLTSEALHALRHHRHIDTSKAQQRLGFQARPLRETLADTLQWFRQSGQLR